MGCLSTLRAVREGLRVTYSTLPRDRHLREVRRRVEVSQRARDPRPVYSAIAEALKVVLATASPPVAPNKSVQPNQNRQSVSNPGTPVSRPRERKTRQAGKKIQRHRARDLVLATSALHLEAIRSPRKAPATVVVSPRASSSASLATKKIQDANTSPKIQEIQLALEEADRKRAEIVEQEMQIGKNETTPKNTNTSHTP